MYKRQVGCVWGGRALRTDLTKFGTGVDQGLSQYAAGLGQDESRGLFNQASLEQSAAGQYGALHNQRAGEAMDMLKLQATIPRTQSQIFYDSDRVGLSQQAQDFAESEANRRWEHQLETARRKQWLSGLSTVGKLASNIPGLGFLGDAFGGPQQAQAQAKPQVKPKPIPLYDEATPYPNVQYG